MAGRALMIQGTGSGVGKSVIAAALCRLLARRGWRVAPFKAQNMSNNAAVCAGGGEIGRAQAVQAAAAGLEPEVVMNPVLLKPTSEQGSQVVVMGRPRGNFSAREYHAMKKELRPEIEACLSNLKERFEVVVMEGAGSPAEINLKAHDLANMWAAGVADARVLLVGDIDFGGVFAQLVGTLELLEPAERDRVAGLLINKFRGDKAILDPGLDFLEKKTGKKVLGVLPWNSKLNLPEEDSQHLRGSGAEGFRDLYIEVVRFDRIANATDFEKLAAEPDVDLKIVHEPSDRVPDLLILPGSKSTLSDIEKVKLEVWRQRIDACLAAGGEIAGICGGYQMLGQSLLDPDGVEGGIHKSAGLGLLQGVTRFQKHKKTVRVSGRCLFSGQPVQGYEIHTGITESVRPAFCFKTEHGVESFDGEVSEDKKVWGTYLHGVFDQAEFRRDLLNRLRRRKGLEDLPVLDEKSLSDHLDEAADWLEKAVDIENLEAWIR